MPTYEITTDKGKYQVETEATGAASQSSEPDMSQMFGSDQPQAEAPTESPLTALPKGIARGVVQGGQSTLETIANLASILHSPQGPQLDQFVQKSKQGLDQLIPPSNTFSGALGEGLGQVPNMIATYENPASQSVGSVKLAGLLGAINAQKGGVGSMISGAAQNAGQMALLGKAQDLHPALAIPAGAAINAIPAAMQGASGNEVAAQAALGGGFAVATPEGIKKIGDNLKSASEAVQNPKEAFTKFVQGLKEDPITNQYRNLQEGMEANQTEQEGRQQFLKDLTEAKNSQIQGDGESQMKLIDSLKSKEQRQYEVQQKQIKDDRAQTITRLQSQMDGFLSGLPKASLEKARYIQDNWKSFWGQATKQYGPQLESTASKLDGVISPEDQATILNNSARSIVNDYGSDSHPIVQKIFKLLQTKYALPFSDPSSVGLSTEDIIKGLNKGTMRQSPVQESSSSQIGGEPVPFKEFYRDVKNIYDSAPPEDHAGAVLRKNLGDFISKVDPGFRELQSDYSNIVKFREQLGRTFKPWAGEPALKSGENWLKGFVTKPEKGISETDRNLLSFLEAGYSGKKLKMSGIGDLSTDLQSMRMKLDSFKQSLANVKDTTFGSHALELASLAQNHIESIDSLEKKKQLTDFRLKLEMQKTQAEIDATRAKWNAEFEAKKKIYESQKIGVQKLEQDQRKVDGYASAMSYGLASIGQWHLGAALRAGVWTHRAASMRMKKF